MKEVGVIASELEDYVIAFDEAVDISGDAVYDSEFSDPYEIFEKLKEILGWKNTD